jgi:hypothetical protein
MTITSILIAAALSFINGFLWHGPFLGKVWMRLANIHSTGNEKFSDMYGQMFWNYVVNVITAAVMAGVFWIVFASPLMGAITWWRGVIVAAWLWFGFIFTSSSIDVIWMGKSWKLWLFECGASLVSFILMGAVIAALM